MKGISAHASAAMAVTLSLLSSAVVLLPQLLLNFSIDVEEQQWRTLGREAEDGNMPVERDIMTNIQWPWQPPSS
jgi:hypothetical protein